MPKLPDPTPEQQKLLSRVAAAAAQRVTTEQEYLVSIVAAAKSGLTVTQIARATGTTYQAVQSILKNAEDRLNL